MIRQTGRLIFLSFIMLSSWFSVYGQEISPESILSSMKKAADWQLDYPVRFDIDVKNGNKIDQYSILWDGIYVRYREYDYHPKDDENIEDSWKYLSTLMEQNVLFSGMPAEVQKTFTDELKLDPADITHIGMCDKDAKGWEIGAFYVGLEALAKVSGDDKYNKALKLIGESNKWELGERIYHADDNCVGQMYLYMYSLYNKPDMMAKVQMRFDWIINNPASQSLDFAEGQNRWTWCDALFMAPPAWVLLSEYTGDEKYFEFMNKEWWATTEHLYDKEEHLYYRDDRYYDRREENGEKVFWSRGNGWVISALAQIIPNLSDNNKFKEKYIELYKEMMAKIKSIQPEDGMYKASLLDPESYPIKEASGTAFFAYGAAWGVNNGFLNKEEYLPFIEKSWNELLQCIDEDGKLGWTQLPGSEPGDVKEDYNAPYGTGAFLLAGSEIYKLMMSQK